ncbi:hypothetical protein SBF1_2420003 [Candidatus Desulfosporosinus infrequens]|uniref:Uncharacterized protein n=1 Tax=Candidatus Desulfosporosinus infrequens TaxID=2043169 RepID=A0A2U3KNG7_9FIRM|nr:hypothetical protein SBF1_2420003 [Candidatus Desulfosporosinus infrequens]
MSYTEKNVKTSSIFFPQTGHVETCVLLYNKDYAVGEKGKKVTVEVGMHK